MNTVICINNRHQFGEQQIYHFLTSIREFMKTGAGQNKNYVVRARKVIINFSALRNLPVYQYQCFPGGIKQLRLHHCFAE